MNKKYLKIILLIIFVFFLSIGFLIPYTGDDWNNLINHNGNLKFIIQSAIFNYNLFEGRFFSRIFVFLFNYYKPLWVIINAFGMAFLYYFMTKVSIKSNKIFMFLLTFLCLLLVDRETFSQIYVWITGNTTYFIPFLFMIFIIYINRDIFEEKNTNFKYNKIWLIVLPILSFVFSMFVENVSVGIITTIILILIYDYKKYKKINYPLIFSLLSSMIGLYLMLNSPGTKNRIDDMESFSSLSLFSKLLISFPRQMNYVFIKNSFFICLVLVYLIYNIFKNYKGIKKILLMLFVSVIPLITVLANTYYVIFDRYINRLMFFIDCSSIFIFIYWVLFLVLLIYFVIKFNKNDNYKILFFFLIALINNAAMLISPLAGGRTSFLSTIMLYICVIILLDNLNIKLFCNNKILIISGLFCITLMGLFIKHYIYCYNLDLKREEYIKKQLSENKSEIEIIILPEFYLWNANAWNDWHMFTFKEYYNIPAEKSVKLVYLDSISD